MAGEMSLGFNVESRDGLVRVPTVGSSEMLRMLMLYDKKLSQSACEKFIGRLFRT